MCVFSCYFLVSFFALRDLSFTSISLPRHLRTRWTRWTGEGLAGVLDERTRRHGAPAMQEGVHKILK